MKQSRGSDGVVLGEANVRADMSFAAEHAMASLYGATEVMLHVRKSNRAAISLYRDSLGFEVTGVEKGYCEHQ